MLDEARSVYWEAQHLPIVPHTRSIFLPTDALRPGVSVAVAALDIQITRFQIPENLGEDTRLKVLPMDAFRVRGAPTVSGDDLPPGIRHPGEVHQRNNMLRLASVVLTPARLQIFPRPLFIGFEKPDRFLQGGVLVRRTQDYRPQETKQAGAGSGEKGSQEREEGIGHQGELGFTVTRNLRT